MRTPPSAPSPPPCAAAKRKAADGEVFSGDMICEWGQSFRLGFAHPPSTQGRLRLRCSPRLPLLAKGSCLPQQTEGLPLRGIPVFRSAYFPIPHRPTFGVPVFRSAYSASRNARASAAFAASIKPYLCSKTLDLQPLRSPSDAAPNQLFELLRCFGRLFLQNARPPGSLRSPFGGRGELRSPLHPPLPPPLFIGRFAASDRQIPKEDVFIPPNAAFAQLSLAHSAAFCYSFLNNRTRCGKRRLLP